MRLRKALEVAQEFKAVVGDVVRHNQVHCSHQTKNPLQERRAQVRKRKAMWRKSRAKEGRGRGRGRR